jgi:glycogen operon protein
VGGFPPGWAEWNGKYRDTLRAYWKGDQGQLRDLAARVTGSGDMYDRSGRRPWSSVNFITAHDGFTLTDLVSYNDKHNEANGEYNQDGSDDNQSWNCGAEGPSDDTGIKALRARQKRNFLASLLLSHGTPMLLAGDEFGRTQGGNNNAYCQDNEVSWVKWEDIDGDDLALTEFVRRAIELRQGQPLLHRASYRDGMIIRWINPYGSDQTEEQWRDPGARCIGLLLQRPKDPADAEPEGASALFESPEDSAIQEPQGAPALLTIFNAHHEVVVFKLPNAPGEAQWQCTLDTEVGKGDYQPAYASAREIEIPGRCLMLFEPSSS